MHSAARFYQAAQDTNFAMNFLTNSIIIISLSSRFQKLYDIYMAECIERLTSVKPHNITNSIMNSLFYVSVMLSPHFHELDICG